MKFLSQLCCANPVYSKLYDATLAAYNAAYDYYAHCPEAEKIAAAAALDKARHAWVML